MLKPSNIILVTVDSLRADCLGCYGSELGLTPEIDSLALQGILFTDTYAQGPYTAFSLPSLFTGKLPCRLKPIRQGIYWRWRVEGVTVEGATTFVELLKAAGYDTAAFHSNPWVSRFFGFDKGFDVFYDDMLANASATRSWLQASAANLQSILSTHTWLGASALNRRVFAWLHDAHEPFFLWVHYMDTHGPYKEQKFLRFLSRKERLWRKGSINHEKVTTAEREYLLRSYRKQVRSFDEELGKLWRLLDQTGLFGRSLVLLSADHGEEFFEHGGYAHTHKLYDELLHVPLIACVPGGKPWVQHGLTALTQIAPTILEFAGLAAENGFDGSSLFPCLLGQPLVPSPYVISEADTFDENICVRTPEWKLIWKRGRAEQELYHLAADRSEQRNLASEHPQIVRELERLLLAHRTDPARSIAAAPPEALASVTKEEEKMVATFHDEVVAGRCREGLARNHSPGGQLVARAASWFCQRER